MPHKSQGHGQIYDRLKSLRSSPTPNSAGKDVKSLIMKDTLTWYESFKLKSFTLYLLEYKLNLISH